MKKTLIFLSLLALCLLGIMSSSARAAIPMAATVWDRPHEFTDISLMFVMNPQGQYLGRITDLLFDSQGKVSFAIVSRPGIIGMPGNPLAVPFNTLSYDNKQKVFVADISWERLQSAPVFSKEELTDQKWAEDTYKYFGQQPAWTVGETKGKRVAAESRKEALPAMSGWQRPYEASEILGTHMMNRQGEDLGRISNLVLDTRGRVSFVILAHGGFLRIGEKLTPVPFGALSYDTEKHLVLDITREKLESAPVFSRKTLGDLQWAKEVYRYFGQQPYWTEK